MTSTAGAEVVTRERLLRADEVAEMLGISVRQVYRIPESVLPRNRELGPRLTRYRLADVERLMGGTTPRARVLSMRRP